MTQRHTRTYTHTHTHTHTRTHTRTFGHDTLEARLVGLGNGEDVRRLLCAEDLNEENVVLTDALNRAGTEGGLGKRGIKRG